MLNVNRNGIDTARVDIILTSGEKVIIDSSRIMENGVTIEDVCSDSSTFSLGFTSCKTLTVNILNYDEKYNTEDFEGAKVIPYIINDNVTHKRGEYILVSPTFSKGELKIECNDNVYKLEKDIDVSLFTLPCGCGDALKTATDACGIELGTPSFTNSDVEIISLDGITTYRELANNIMQIAGSVLKANTEGVLVVCDYKKAFVSKDTLDGGNLENYKTGDTADGGNFTDYTTGYNQDGGSFGDREDIIFKYDISDITVAANDTVITGISATIEDTLYKAGQDGYMLDISDNKIINERNINEVITVLNKKYSGMRFRQLEGKLTSDFRLESMDPVSVIDYKGNIYDCYLTKVTYTIRNKTDIACSGKNKEENKTSDSNVVTKIIKMCDSNADNKVKKEASIREQAIAELANKIANGTGMFCTQEKTADGGTIYYTHDKPNLKDSTFVTKYTAEAIGLSMDGGKTYPYGYTVTAKMVMDIIVANKISGSYIYGGTIVLGGENNKNGVLELKTANGDVVVSLNKDGIQAVKGKIGNLQIIENGFLVGSKSSGISIELNENESECKIEAYALGEPAKGTYIKIKRNGMYIKANGIVQLEGGAAGINLKGDVYVNGKELSV